jgi:catechol 2,3-dioxygenase-like lactoylglutathione lyase family enzyme
VSSPSPAVRLGFDGPDPVESQEPERSNEMKPNSISGISCYVEDLSRTAEFYEALGFRRGKEESDRVTFYVNWFFVTFVAKDHEDDAELRKEAELPNKGAGLFLHIKVDDVEDFYKEVLANSMSPAGEPQTRASGNRDFVLRDPDGYKLVFFQKK